MLHVRRAGQMGDVRWDEVGKAWDDRVARAAVRLTDNPKRTALKWGAGLTAFLLVMLVIGNALSITNVFWNAEKAKLTVQPRVTQQTYSTGNALHFISYFHSQCNTILADEQAYENALSQLAVDQKTLSSVTDPIAQQQAGQAVSTDNTDAVGAKDQLSNDVRDYDARSADQTAEPFKAAGLPHRIDLTGKGLLDGNINCH